MPSVKQPPTLSSILRENGRKYRDKVATVSDGVRHTYGEMVERVDRLANGLAASGVGRGDRILWMGQNSHRALETILAAGDLGAMVSPINWRQSAAEQQFVLEDFSPKVVIWQAEATAEVIGEVRRRSSHEALWIQHDGDGPDGYEAFLSADFPPRPVYEPDENDPVFVIYTAAFGGKPNGAMLTHRNITTQAMMMAYLQDLGPTTVWLAAGPMFHVGVWITTWPVFVFGGTNVFTRTTEAQAVCEAIHNERCTDGYVLPPMLPKVLELVKEGNYDLSCLRSSINHPEWAELTRPDNSLWGTKLSFFGQAEVTSPVTHASFGGGREGLGTAGVPVPFAQVRIFGENDEEVPEGEVGEIVVRGPMVCAGYWNRPELNAERMRSGWWHTNDLGRREADGSILFVAPKTRLLKSGNENIYPAEVEQCLEAHEAVKDAAIIGVPDEKWTQTVKAIVVLKDGRTLTEEEVIAWCRRHMAGYKRPHSVEFLDEIPRLNGSTDYDALDEKFGGGGYPGGRTRVR